MQILEKLCERGFDFRQYKESGLKRRIEKRLRATRVDTYQQYIEVLDKDPGEYKNLLNALTIKVTEFFRDPEAWQSLCDKILSEIVREKMEDKREDVDVKPLLRIWSAGCATGEEAYSAAISADHFLGERGDELGIEIWGTDIHNESLLKARQAEYKSDMVKGVPQNILNKYFNFNGNFRVKSFVGEKIQFKFHDLVLDEPLTEMDIIICRNVAIYFEKSLQEKVFIDFYNSLNEGGCLFLGKAETLIGPARERFHVVDKRWKIYRKGY